MPRTRYRYATKEEAEATMRAYKRTWQATHRARARAAGQCARCSCPVIGTYANCFPCRLKESRRRRALAAATRYLRVQEMPEVKRG